MRDGNQGSSLSARLPNYVFAMVRRSPPESAPVVADSTPVVAFGDPSRAAVATLGINPSANEFLDHGRLLEGGERRLATLPSLGATRLDELTDLQVGVVVDECATYFQRRPYRRWCDPLDQLPRTGAGVSHYEGSACHLDLVQWATEPIWGRIPDRSVRSALLEDGAPHLRAQLAEGHVRLVLLNGREVLDQVAAVGLVELDEVGRLPIGGGSCGLYAGEKAGVRWVGWSTTFRAAGGSALSSRRTSASGSPRGVTRQPSPRRMSAPRCRRRSTSPVTCRAGSGWRANGSSSRCCEAGCPGPRRRRLGTSELSEGARGSSCQLGNHEAVLNADCKRAALQQFVTESESQLARPWRVVANRRGRINKVLPGPDASPLPGWYAYLTRPLDEELTI